MAKRFSRDRDGRFRPRLGSEERELLEQLPRQVVHLVQGDGPSVRRLFPPAYPGDEQAEADYRALVGESLRARHGEVLEALAATAGAETLAEDELQRWMAALEVLRLVIGTDLDVAEDMPELDPGDPRAPRLALYAYLSVLQGEIVDALAGALPPAGRGR